MAGHVELEGQTISKAIRNGDSEIVLKCLSGEEFVIYAQGDEFYEEDPSPLIVTKVIKFL